MYACFIQRRRYSDSYLSEADKVLRRVSEVLHQELVSDGRLGACIDASGVLTQGLELLGIWAYQVIGGLIVSFPSDSGIEAAYFYPYDMGTQFSAAHSWIVAPPFAIIDVTIRTQPYSGDVNAYLPNVVLEPNVTTVDYSVDDVCSPSHVSAAQRAGYSKAKLDKTIHENLAEFHSVFPPSRLMHESTQLKYVPNGITSFDGPLEENKSLCLNGRYGLDIYKNVVLPAANG